jgi:hypothetical protein
MNEKLILFIQLRYGGQLVLSPAQVTRLAQIREWADKVTKLDRWAAALEIPILTLTQKQEELFT